MKDGYYQPDDILARVERWLAPVVKKKGGNLSVASDPWNFLEKLALSPTGFLCVLHWNGDSNTSENTAEAGTFLDNVIEIGISTNLGLTIDPEAGLYKPRSNNAVPLLRLVGELRDHVRGLLFPDGTTNRVLTLRGTVPVTMPTPTGNVPLAAYKLTFGIITAPPPVQFTEPR